MVTAASVHLCSLPAPARWRHRQSAARVSVVESKSVTSRCAREIVILVVHRRRCRRYNRLHRCQPLQLISMRAPLPNHSEPEKKHVRRLLQSAAPGSSHSFCCVSSACMRKTGVTHKRRPYGFWSLGDYSPRRLVVLGLCGASITPADARREYMTLRVAESQEFGRLSGIWNLP